MGPPKTVLDLPAEYFRAARANPPSPEQQAELAEAVRKFCERAAWGDELTGWGEEVRHRDVVVVPASLLGEGTTPTSTAMGKEWVPLAFERRRDELSRLRITQAGIKLADESKTASDCRKPLSKGYCTNELRTFGIWEQQLRQSPKQRPSR